MIPPILVIEAVSPGDVQRDRDYIAQRFQYQDRGIPEYWLIDPGQNTITILQLVDDAYQSFGVFSGDVLVEFPTFGQFSVTAEQILSAGQQAT